MMMQMFVGLVLFVAASSKQAVNPLSCEHEGCSSVKEESMRQMLIQVTHDVKTPIIDEDADLITDADNPLEKMYAWEDGKAAIEKSTEERIDYRDDKPEEEDFNCNEGIAEWSLGWSDMKKDFCCRTYHLCGVAAATLAARPANAKKASACVTGEEFQSKSHFYTNSPAGTPCIFGVDPRDEGSHCILSGEKYGSYGWCYTSKSKSSWGPCSESCPLFGLHRVLGEKIDKIDRELGAKVRAEVSKVLAEQKGDTTAKPAAEGTAPGGNGTN